MKNPRITAVEVVKTGILRVTWNDTETYDVDISDSLATGMKPVSKPSVFARASIGEFGLSVDCMCIRISRFPA